MRDVAIIGYAATPVGRYEAPAGAADDAGIGPMEHEFGARVIRQAVRDAGLERKDIEALVVAFPGAYARQGYFNTFLANYLRLPTRAVTLEVIGNGMTGGHTFDQAAQQIRSGQARVALAVAAHFETGTPTDLHLENSIRLTGDINFQSVFGCVPIAWYAMDAQRYMHDHGVTRRQLAHIAVKNRRHAALNPLAQFSDPIDVDTILAQRLIVSPLGLLEVPGRADGAVCLVLADAEVARSLGKPYLLLRGRGFQHEGLHQLDDQAGQPLYYQTARIAFDRALAMAGISREDIDLAEIYAPCTIVEALASEALGFAAPGQGAAIALAGDTTLGGRIPLNTSGGAMSRGHPPEATPLYDIVEVCEQLLGRGGARQVRDARFGMAVCELGKYNAALVQILEAVR